MFPLPRYAGRSKGSVSSFGINHLMPFLISPVDKRLRKSFIHRFVGKSFFGILFIMRFNIPKNDSKYHWTQHSVRKMLFYGLTVDRVKRIIRNPKRVENGVAENTIAVMQSTGTSKKPTEMW